MPQMSKPGIVATRRGRPEVDRRLIADYDPFEDFRGEQAYCCLPSGCPRRLEDPVDPRRPGDAVKVSCSDKRCEMGAWMHGDCFQDWEEEVLAYLCSSGRAKSWSAKQKHQNVWTRKGYDLVYKACLCMCGHGYLRRDLHEAVRADDTRRKQQQQATSMGKKDRHPEPEGLRIQTCDLRPYTRQHRSSISSSGGSSPPSSTGTPPPQLPGSPTGWFSFSPPVGRAQQQPPHSEFFADARQAATGNIFAHRTDLSGFDALPRGLWNAYNIRSEDEGPHGTDETRSFVLTTLSAKGITSVGCVLCQSPLAIYDKYPLVDGTFFLSPQRYDPGVPVMHKKRPRCLAAVCLRCLSGGAELCCRSCQTRWNGSMLVLGSMYAYDIFAAAPCCPARLACNQCGLDVFGPNSQLPQSFSDYSRSFVCPHCHADDNHFAKPLHHVFGVVK